MLLAFKASTCLLPRYPLFGLAVTRKVFLHPKGETLIPVKRL